jgi:hypothetical protein
MAAMLKTRPRSNTTTKPAMPVEETESGTSRYSPLVNQVGPESEAPEDAIRESEPPENWEEWHAEAPDAGRGGCQSIESEFTHGRSRS